MVFATAEAGLSLSGVLNLMAEVPFSISTHLLHVTFCGARFDPFDLHTTAVTVCLWRWVMPGVWSLMVLSGSSKCARASCFGSRLLTEPSRCLSSYPPMRVWRVRRIISRLRDTMIYQPGQTFPSWLHILPWPSPLCMQPLPCSIPLYAELIP